MRCALFGLLLALTACGDSSGPSDAEVEGNYVLTRLNDAALPYDHEGLGCCTYLNGSITLVAGNYTIAVTARNRTSLVEFTENEFGTYSRSGSALSFTPQGQSTGGYFGLSTGTLSDGSLRASFGGEGPGSPDQFRGLFVKGAALLR